MLRNLFLWVFFSNIPIANVTGQKEYLEGYSNLQLAGFSILVLGVLIYNEILVIPFFGFNTNTKIAIEKRTRTESRFINYDEDSSITVDD